MSKEIIRWKIAAEKLWALLDDIDTASDAFKPSDEEGYKAFFCYVMRKAEERGKILRSTDGYTLHMTPGFEGAPLDPNEKSFSPESVPPDPNPDL